jgi:chorismate dehydratase
MAGATPIAYSHGHTMNVRTEVIRIGCVSYLNSCPLVWGLDRHPDLEIRYAVPAALLGLLTAGECEVALLPAIDYQRADDLVLVPGSCIGADGTVYTVRLFSRVPVGRIRRLYADVESHTSVALCRILLKHVYGVEPEFTGDESAEVDARLLIGDKVVVRAPKDHPIQLDLADEWKRWTGLPFVFAGWMARRNTCLGDLPERLAAAMQQGLEHVDCIVKRDAIPRGWPAEVARDYLTRLLKFPIDLAPRSPQRQAIERFHALAYELGVVPRNRPIEIAVPCVR